MAWRHQQKDIDVLRKTLIGIATQGCESFFEDDQDMCSTVEGYCKEDWCNPCLANEALEAQERR